MATAPQLKSSTQAPLRLNAEFDLLLACCRNVTGGGVEFNEIVELPLNWERVFKLAEHHRLLPPLHAALCERDDIPASIRLAIRARFQKHVQRTLRFLAELARILRYLDDRGIRVLAHKGPVLAELLYSDSAMRQFGDLDFLLRPHDVARARAALAELGYEPRLQLSTRQEQEYLHSGYEYVFGLGTERNLVELQWQIVPRFYAIDFDIERLFQRSVEVQIEGSRARTLGSEDLMLVLCVHAAKHEWAQAGMLRDIATLASRDLDWRWIEAEARRLGIFNILGISLSLAHNLFHSEMPNPFKSYADAGVANRLVGSIQARLACGVELDTESWRYFHATMHQREQWVDRIRSLFRLATTPSVGEWQTVRLPDRLFFLYRGVRLLRLLKRLVSHQRNS